MEPAVGVGARRRVGQRVVAAQILVEARERLEQVVGAVEALAAGLAGEDAEPDLRGAARDVAQVHGRRLADAGGGVARGVRGVAAGEERVAAGAQAGRVDRVDGDVDPIGLIDERVEAHVEALRDRESLR